MTIQELYGRIDGNYESAKRVMQLDKLIAKFILKYPGDESCAALCAAWDARDAAGVFEGAHAMKGVCANLGLDALAAAASELAEEFRPGHTRALDDESVQARVDALRSMDEKARAGIRAFADAQEQQ